MDVQQERVIWTIGHSTHTQKELIAMLHSFDMECLVDIRRFPGSKRYPHFNKEVLALWLRDHAINYVHIPELGGRRKPLLNSINTALRNINFRAYADYMETEVFKQAIFQLESMAIQHRTVYMCSEAVWWSCHRSLVSDYLKVRGWSVRHVMGIGKEQEHPYTSAANIAGGKLSYDEKLSKKNGQMDLW